jgi:STE24 endopeptidase
MWYGLVFFGILGLLNAVYSIPFDLYNTFKIEEKHGFNRQKISGFISDKIKGIVLSMILGGGFLSLIFLAMDSGPYWWLLAWGTTALFTILVSWLYPTLLAPLFNKFSPLPEGDLRDGIYALAKKIDFRTSGIYVMDASKRSSHGNAYFTGMFGEKRIVLFDTLLESLSPQEIVAVLAHELGHFKLHHVRVGLIRSMLIMGGLFYILSLCKPLESFYHAFGFSGVSNYAAIIVFSLWYGIVGFVFNPLQAWLSQRNEFAADAFAKKNLNSYEDLANALVKLQKKNQSMPLTDPTFSFFYYSHPPILQRLAALKTTVESV